MDVRDMWFTGTRLRRALLFGALLVSLAVPCGAAGYALSGTGSANGAAVQLPAGTQPEAFDDPLVVDDAIAEPAPPAAAPESQEVAGAEGGLVTIDKSCGRSHDLDARETNVVQARGELVGLRRRLRAADSVFSTFLDTHPQKTLPTAKFNRYTSLRVRYEAALAAYNRQVDVANRYIRRYNAVVDGCRI
jgi:hypothetical protein